MGERNSKRTGYGGVMALALVTVLGSSPAAAQSANIKEYMRRQSIMLDVLRRAREVMPRRRDEPLRDLNISDDEVREIQILVRDLLPKAIVNIGPVVTGCPCEEGVGCTEQVYIEASSATKSVGLLLSRSRNRWDVSEAQKWWLRWQSYEDVQDELSWTERDEREWQLVQDFPVCTRGTRKVDNTAVPSNAEPRK